MGASLEPFTRTVLVLVFGDPLAGAGLGGQPVPVVVRCGKAEGDHAREDARDGLRRIQRAEATLGEEK